MLSVFESDVRIQVKSLNNESLIHTAVHKGNLEIVMCLVNHGAQVDAKDNYGSTPLHTATELKKRNIAQYLIENGAQIDAKEAIRRQTPLHLAAGAGYLDLVTLLVEKGACIDVLDTNNETPFDDAIKIITKKLPSIFWKRRENMTIENHEKISATKLLV